MRLWVEMRLSVLTFSKPLVSLLVRLWVEILQKAMSVMKWEGQPPCEAVSWNTRALPICSNLHRQPPCEAVSWNAPLVLTDGIILCQPPCEAVSWNVRETHNFSTCPRQPPCEAVSWNVRILKQRVCWDTVSLLVRLWVEMLIISELL